MARTLERYEKKVDTLTESVSDLKSTVGSLKAEIKTMKDSKSDSKKCTYCGGWGHTEDSCRKKKDAEKAANP